MRRTRIHPAAATAWALFLLAFVLVPRLVPDEAGVRAALERLGAFGPAAFVLAEAVQVVIVPIPGQPLEIPGGYLFGLVPGIVLGSLGAIAGSILAFAIGRRYGRPWVESRIDASARERFDAWLGRGHRAEWAVFWLMLVPAFPRDPLCYLAGLTRLSAGRFALIAVIGRPVGLAPWVALGAGGVAAGLRLQIVLAAAVGIVWLLHLVVGRIRPARAARGLSPSPIPSNGDPNA